MESTLSTTPRESEIWGFLSPALSNTFHLATATPTTSPVYGVFLTITSTSLYRSYNKTRTWSSLSPRNLSIKFGTNPSTFHNLFSYRGHRQTHKPTPVKTYSLAFAGRITCQVVDEERIRPGHWLGLVLCVPFSYLIIMVGLQKEHPAHKTPIPLISTLQRFFAGTGEEEGPTSGKQLIHKRLLNVRLVGWSLTALSTQFRSYRAFKVELYYQY